MTTTKAMAKEIRLDSDVRMIHEDWQDEWERTVSGLAWNHVDVLDSGDRITVSDQDGTYIAEVYDTCPERGEIYIDLK